MKSEKKKQPSTTPFAARVNTKKLNKAVKKNGGKYNLREKVKNFIEMEGE